MKNYLLMLLLTMSVILPACKKEGCTDPTAFNFDPNAKVDDGSCVYEGCTDPAALNYDPLATIPDGTCDFSNLVFYNRYPNFLSGLLYYTPYKTDLIVNNVTYAMPLPYTYYNNGPGNCAAPGTFQFEFIDGKSYNWSSKLYFANGTILIGSGTVKADNRFSCIAVPVY